MFWIGYKLSVCFTNFLVLLLFSFRSSDSEMLIDRMKINETSCNEVILTDDINNARVPSLGTFYQRKNQCPDRYPDRCVYTYRGKTDIIRKAYKICFTFRGFVNCKTSLKVVHSKGEKLFTCRSSLFLSDQKLCSNQDIDLRLIYRSYNVCADKFITGTIYVDLKPTFSNTINLVNRCINRESMTTRHLDGTVISEYDPDSTSCSHEFKLILELANWNIVKFCIEFMEFKFYSGGATLRIDTNKLSDSSMIFSANSQIPKNQKICRSWKGSMQINIAVIPGANPNNKERMKHAFLFHYTTVKDENSNGNNDFEEGDDYGEDGAGNFWLIFFTVLSSIGCTCLAYCCCGREKKSNTAEVQQPPPYRLDAPLTHPAFVNLLDSSRTALARPSRPAGQQLQSVRREEEELHLTQPVEQEPPSAPSAPSELPSYESLFPNGHHPS